MEIKVLVFTIGLCVLIGSTSGLRCLPCIDTPDRCRDPAKPQECPHGLVTDICNCCNVCGQGPGDKCGGPWDFDGKCGPGLSCVPISGLDGWGYDGKCEWNEEAPPLEFEREVDPKGRPQN